MINQIKIQETGSGLIASWFYVEIEIAAMLLRKFDHGGEAS